jgi:outer membrane lipoprotein-sorting protein
MKIALLNKVMATILLSLAGIIALYPQDAKAIVKRANDKMRGERSSKSEMTMTIVRPTWQRELSFKNWTLGTQNSLVLVTDPAKEKGQSFLKRGREMWSWNPSINRLIKLPPSMLSQGWMGSDFTNDDIVNESSIVVDYNHTIKGNEHIEGYDCYLIELIPKEDAPVVWGRILVRISKTDDLILKSEYFDEDDFLVQTEIVSDIKMMDGRKIPSHFELIPEEKEGHKTMLDITSIVFDISISESFFSQQNMKRVR